MTRRLTLENFVAFAPDALFPLGGYPGDEDAARAAFVKLDQARTRKDFIAAAEWLRVQRGVKVVSASASSASATAATTPP